jgi:hypothetical protein
VNRQLRAELREMAEADQVARRNLVLDDEETVAAMQAVDRVNTARLREIVAAGGWPGRSLVGPDGASAAWCLVQHADHDFQETCLPLLERAVQAGEATAADLAYLTDRVLMHRGEPQLYGTQFRIRDGTAEPFPIADEENLDRRRADAGLEPFASYHARLASNVSNQRGQTR